MPRVLGLSGILVLVLLSPLATEEKMVGAAAPGAPAQPSARDHAAAKDGTAILRGRVVAADSGQALRKAQVRLFSPELREGRSASTDSEGRYEFRDLPAGRYTVSAGKGSYVSLQYGQKRPFESGKPVELVDAQTIEKIDFSLPKGAVITGRVLDEFGEPITDVQVSVQRYQFMQGRRQLMNAGRSGSTNDIGEFRIFGLSPGQYYLSAVLRNFQMAATEDRSGYAPTYYPNALTPESAQKITVGLGETISDLTMTLTSARTARVSGTVVSSQGKPMPGMIMVVQRSGNGFMSSMGGRVLPDGTFSLSGVAPGEYTLQTNGGMGGDDPEFASADITVAGEDLAGVALVATKPVTITGRVIVPPSALAAFRPGEQRVFASPVQSGGMPFAPGNRPGTVKDDLTFSLKASPGKTRFSVNGQGGPGTTFYVRAIRLNGMDVIDSGVDIRPNEDLSGLEIELTSIASTLSGSVNDDRGEALKDYTLVVFPQDREKWESGSRYLRIGRPDQDGRFKVTALPPGEYEAVALEFVEPGEQSDPDFLDSVKSKATAFSIGEGETKTLNLKLSPPS
jgi:hypothetical protein